MEQKYEAERQEAQKRFDTLPENLKKEIQADKNVDLIHSVCRDYSIPEEKVKYITMLVGEVFLGYIKPEEVAHELNTYFDIDLQKSNFIEIELKQKLFNGLKNDLDKIYNPLSAEALAKEDEMNKEASPAIIKLEPFGLAQDNKEAAPLAGQQLQPKISPLMPGAIKTLTEKTQEGASFDQAQDKPFIIQTKVEAVKAAIPQFPKESPSLNLKVDPSIIQKGPIIKPISVHLETTQQAQEKKFQMPVIAGQKIFSGAPIEKSADKPLPNQVLPATTQTNQTKIEIKPQFESKNSGITQIKTSLPASESIKIPIQPKNIASQPQPMAAPSLKQISEQKIVSPLIERKPIAPELPKIVHYSSFKTDLANPRPAKDFNAANIGAPILRQSQQQEKTAPPKPGEARPITGREDFINLNTFTKVSGNTIDLRNDKRPTTNN